MRTTKKYPVKTRLNYGAYRLNWQERVGLLIEITGLMCIVNYLCYRSFWAFLPEIPVGIWYARRRIRQKAEKRRQRLYFQFQDMLHGLQTAVRAGYSMEQAVVECRKELELIYGEKENLIGELLYMEQQMKVGVPLERLFLDFGKRSGVEDIRCFGEILQIARRSGGNLGAIMEKMAEVLGNKIAAAKQIEVSIAAKKTEQLIMSFVPGGMILYMEFTSPGMLGVLYGNMAGASIMTGCLVLYLCSFLLGRKIVRIDV